MLHHKEIKQPSLQLREDLLWILRYNHDTLDEDARKQLRSVFKLSPKLHQAYTLREELTAIFNMPLTVTDGQRRLHAWIAKVKRSSVTCFNKFLNTLDNHFDFIANYFDRRANSGFVEGLNNKLKVITRRCYGLRRVDSLFRRLWLDVHGYRRLFA